MGLIRPFDGEYKTQEELTQEGEAKTGQIRCIGCGRFVRRSDRWNQCSDCRDTEER